MKGSEGGGGGGIWGGVVAVHIPQRQLFPIGGVGDFGSLLSEFV